MPTTTYKCECGSPGCSKEFEVTPEEARELGTTDVVVIARGCRTVAVDHAGEFLRANDRCWIFTKVRPE